MKTILSNSSLIKLAALWVLLISSVTVMAQATVSTPMGIGRNCNAGTSTTATSDSVKLFSFNDATNTFTKVYSCKPSLGVPGFSPYSGSVAYNPADQKLYYIETTNGSNSYIFRWTPNTCPTGSLAPAYSYTNRYIVGMDFDPVTGNGYQLEFNGSTAPYVISLRKVNFTTGTFGPSDTLNLPAGKNIYVQSGDVVFTPLGQLYFAFDNKLFQVDYSNYGAGVHLNTTFIDTLRLGNTLLGLSYAHGKFIASTQNGGNTSCSFSEIDISSGSAVISPITMPSGTLYTGTDLASFITGIGVAKKVSAVSVIAANQYQVQYDIKIKNFGNTSLNNVQLIDSIAKVFGASFVSASAAAVGTLPSGITLNSLYNGNTICTLFSGTTTSTMNAAPLDSAIVRVTVNLNNPNVNTTYYSTSTGLAQSLLFGTPVVDSSNNSGTLQPDPNLNDVPDDTNENVQTPLKLSTWIILANRVNDFNASLKNGAVQLDWALENTDEELTTYIQRSSNGTNFENIGSIRTAVSTGKKQYQWFDRSPVSEKDNFYRLAFERKNNTSFYSNTVRISMPRSKTLDVVVTPNPFNHQVNMQVYLAKDELLSYSLVDFNGNVVFHSEKQAQAGDNSIRIGNLEHAPAGLYLLQVKAGMDTFRKTLVKSN